MNTSTPRFVAAASRAQLDRAARLATAGLVVVCAALLAPRPAHAQPHTVSEGGYTLRASTVATGVLPEAMRQKYAIGADPRKAVLNVMVSAAGSQPAPIFPPK